MHTQNVIIDTDPGQDIDDLLALLFALKRPELAIRAITTVTYPTDKRARLVKRLLRGLGRADIPVGAGAAYPLSPISQADTDALHNLAVSMNHYAFAEPEHPADAPDSDDAADLIIRTVDALPAGVALLCLGPLTNIAAALARKPDIARNIAYIALMGGEVALDRAEHNIAFDYLASDAVLRAGVPIFMGTWSVTRQFALSMDDCAYFRKSADPLLAAIGRAIDLWHPAQSWKPGPVMYDIFPIIWAFDRSLYDVAPMRIRVETVDPATRGKTVVCDAGTEIHVTTGIRADAVRERYFETVFGDAPQR